MPRNLSQFGGGNCSLCGSPGTNKSTCPLNPKARRPNPLKHFKALKETSSKSEEETARFRLNLLKTVPVLESTILYLKDPREIDALCQSTKELMKACKGSKDIRDHIRHQRLVYVTAWDGVDPPEKILNYIIKSSTATLNHHDYWTDAPTPESEKEIAELWEKIVPLYDHLNKVNDPLVNELLKDFTSRYPKFANLLNMLGGFEDHMIGKLETVTVIKRFHQSLSRLEEALKNVQTLKIPSMPIEVERFVLNLIKNSRGSNEWTFKKAREWLGKRLIDGDDGEGGHGHEDLYLEYELSTDEKQSLGALFGRDLESLSTMEDLLWFLQDDIRGTWNAGTMALYALRKSQIVQPILNEFEKALPRN